MSKMEELVHEISFTVEKLTSRITEEKEKIKKFNEKQKRTLEEIDRMNLNNQQLKVDIEQLQQTFFRETQQSRSLSTANDLVEKRLQTLAKVVEDIRAAGEKMRAERLQVLNEFREKINEYEHVLQKNFILLQFVEKWRENAEKNQELIALPGIVQNLAQSLSHFYKIDLAGTLENIAENVENLSETGDMEMTEKATTGTVQLVKENTGKPAPINEVSRTENSERFASVY